MWWSGESGSGLGSGSGDFNNTTAFDDSTLSCAARSVQGPVQYPYHRVLIAIVRVCQSTVFFLAAFGAFLLNGLVVILVVKYKKLQKVPLKIAVNLAAINALLSFATVLAMISSIANRWLFGVHMCGLLGASLVFVAIGRAMVLFIFVIDRFLSVFMPIAYPRHQKLVLIILFLATWLISLVIMVIAYVLDCYEFIDYALLCYLSAACSGTCSILTSLINVVIFAPLNVIPVVLYIMLFIKAKKVKKSLVENEKYDWNATITFFLIFLTAFALLLPQLLVLLILQTIYRNSDTLPVPLHLWLVASLRLTAPIPITDAIFILNNKDIKEVIKEVAGKLLKKKRSVLIKKKTNIIAVKMSVKSEEVHVQELHK